MRKLLRTLVVAVLALSASGVSEMITGEPCLSSEAQGRADGNCPPTCATCGCCAQAAEAVVLAIAVSSEFIVADVLPVIPRLLKSEPGEILHVPKPLA